MKTYEQMQVKLIRKTQDPGKLIKLASDLTQKREPSLTEASKKLIKYLITANHTSLFEHISTTWLISGVSRSFLAQITRHRMASYTSASQHYQDYSQYPCVVSQSIDTLETLKILKSIDWFYEWLIQQGIKPEEARQILPNAKAVNILWTVNVRSLINFLNLRLCERNVEEMKLFASIISNKCIKWWPEVFTLVGPDCVMLGKCRQGKMKAKICKEKGSPWIQHIY